MNDDNGQKEKVTAPTSLEGVAAVDDGKEQQKNKDLPTSSSSSPLQEQNAPKKARITSSTENDNDGDADADEKHQQESTNNNNKEKNRRAGDKKTWNDDKVHQIHLGSYAHPETRNLFGIELPSFVVDDNNNDNETTEKEHRQKRKLAFLLGYLGTGYSGFQINEGQRTLQGDFELAMLQTRLLNRHNFGVPYKYGWSTSGRTDKGVHACAQVVSCKVELLPQQSMDDVRNELNSKLPENFRVLDVVRTTRNFCAKTQRDRVRYQYMIPSFILQDVSTVRKLFEDAGCPLNGRDAFDPLSPEELDQLRPHCDKYRASKEQLDTLRNALKVYQGTHSFHAFTKGVKPGEARATRYILSFKMQEPMLYGGVEWIPTQVLGQSFLLHQIRKMVAMAMDVARGAVPLETITRALDPKQNNSLRLNVAPAQGLFMEMSYYEGYNKRKKANAELDDIEWHNESNPAYARWEEFRNNVVMKHIAEEEKKEGNFIKHLFTQEYIFNYKRFYGLDGGGGGGSDGENEEEQK